MYKPESTRRQMEDKAQKDKALSESRYIFEDMHWRGVGLKVFQLVYMPSFETHKIWDVRKQGENYVLFESTISKQDLNIIEPGYDELDIDTESLKKIIDSFNYLSIPTRIPDKTNFGLDGTGYGISLYGFGVSVSFKWWSKPHESWIELFELTEKTIEIFRNSEKKIMKHNTVFKES